METTDLNLRLSELLKIESDCMSHITCASCDHCKKVPDLTVAIGIEFDYNCEYKDKYTISPKEWLLPRLRYKDE